MALFMSAGVERRLARSIDVPGYADGLYSIQVQHDG
jgi:hypothetical protein